MRCAICQGSRFDIYYRNLDADVSELEEGKFPISPTISYVECSKCGSTIWGIDSGWYPCLESDRERWRARGKLKMEIKNDFELASLLRNLSREQIEQLVKSI